MIQTISAVSALMILVVGLLSAYYSKNDRVRFGLILTCLSPLVGLTIYIRFGDLSEIRKDVAQLRTGADNRCQWLLKAEGIPLLDGARQAAKDTCEKEKFLRGRASVAIPREEIMPVWCKMLQDADEVWATNVAGDVDWEQFKGKKDPCALSCQTRARRIHRVFIYDQDSDAHRQFSFKCAEQQAKRPNISVRLIPLRQALHGPPAEIPRAVEAAGGLDVVVISKDAERIGMLTEIDMATDAKIALRSYFYEDPERIKKLKELFDTLWGNAPKNSTTP